MVDLNMNLISEIYKYVKREYVTVIPDIEQLLLTRTWKKKQNKIKQNKKLSNTYKPSFK